MRVAVFTDTFLPQVNGVTNTLRNLIQYYEKEKIDYLIFAPDSYTELKYDFNIEKFLSFRFFMYPECRLTIPNIFRLKSSLMQFKPDIIHIMTEFNMGVMGLTYGKKLGIPTISNYTTNFSQYLSYYNLDFLEAYSWNYMQWFHNQNDMTLCPSQETRSLLKDHGIYNTGIFSRGVDYERFSPDLRNNKLRERLGISGKLALLYVGRIAPEKDLDVLCESYKNLMEQYGDKIALIITGDGPELSRYKKLFPANTIFTGYKKGKELAELYASSDIFTFPSPTETFGNVVLEAMASGLPVIVPDAGGVKNIVDDGSNGLIFKSGNHIDLEKGIIRLIEDNHLRNELKTKGRETALRRSWNKIFGELIDIYDEVILNKKQKCKIVS